MQELVIQLRSRKALPNMPVKRSDVVRAIIVRTKKVFVDKMECIFDLMIMLCL
jgi:ribosomal protein L14